MLKYREYRDMRQREFNALPIFYAFSEEQFKTGMEKHGLTENDTDKIYQLVGGGFVRKDEAHLIHEWYEMDELPKMMEDFDFAYEAFYEEMANHEYHINWQGDWDVLTCFYDNVEFHEEWDAEDYINSVTTDKDVREAYILARKNFMRKAHW